MLSDRSHLAILGGPIAAGVAFGVVARESDAMTWMIGLFTFSAVLVAIAQQTLP